MSKLERFGTGGIGSRRLYLMELADVDALPSNLALEGRHFACAILMDADSMETDAIGRMSVSLLEQGLVYACTWGPGCKRVHDIIDEEVVGGGPVIPRFPLLVMTSWHSGETLDDALYFWLFNTTPHENLARSCRSSLVLSIGNRAWSVPARQAIWDPEGFRDRVLDADEAGD